MGKIYEKLLEEAKEREKTTEIPKMEPSDVVNSETFNLQLDMLFAAYCEIVERYAFSESENQYFVLVYKKMAKFGSGNEFVEERFRIHKGQSFNNFVAIIRDLVIRDINFESYRLIMIKSSLYRKRDKKYLDDISDKVTWNKSFFERLIGKKKE